MGAKYLAVDEVDHLIAFLMTLSGETILPEDMGPTPEVAIDFGMNIDEGKPTRGKIMAAGLRCIGCRLCAVACPDIAFQVYVHGTFYQFFSY